MTQLDRLLNTPTMAPIKEYRQPDNNARTLASIGKSSIASIESSIYTLTNLLENLRIYKQCVIDSINLQAESADTGGKYQISNYSQSHTLPGVLSVPQGTDERIEQVKSAKEQTLNQKRIYFRLVDKDSKQYFQSLKGMQNSDIAFEEFLEILNDNIDLSIQPHRLDDNPAKTKPSIKLSVDQEPLK